MTVDAAPSPPVAPAIRAIGPSGSGEAEQCARMMAASEPWRTLGRTYQRSLDVVRQPDRDIWVAVDGAAVLGFIIVDHRGLLNGYIQTVCVDPGRRNAGVGSRLVAFAESRIFRESPNVFLCVSTFNPDALRLYQRLGYAVVGELADYLVAGHGEILMRKSRGPWSSFTPPAD